MKRNVIFHNTGLYKMVFSDDGNSLTLFFTDTVKGVFFGEIKCNHILHFQLDTNQFVDYMDKEDSLFPLFIPNIELNNHPSYDEIIINVGIFIKISAQRIIYNKYYNK